MLMSVMKFKIDKLYHTHFMTFLSVGTRNLLMNKTNEVLNLMKTYQS